MRSPIFLIIILALFCRFAQPFKLFHAILYRSPHPLLFLRSNPDVCVTVSSDLTLAGRCSAAVSLQGRCCRKLFDQIVTMTGKQPGRIRFTPYADYYTACKSVSLSINARVSDDCFLWFTRQAALMHSSQISCCSSRC